MLQAPLDGNRVVPLFHPARPTDNTDPVEPADVLLECRGRRDPFLVFTSNVFALLGLRSLYFALAAMIDEFRYLKVSLALVLMVVGVKMMTHVWLKDLAASLLATRRERADGAKASMMS